MYSLARRSTLAAGFAAILAATGLFPGSRAQSEPAGSSSQAVVVELFTSQGCSSCPPADAFLTELAGQPGIIALSLHVDYWDYIGWADPFADPKMTARQRDYSRSFAGRYIYTPQMVIDGRKDVVGSRRGEARDLIAEAAAQPKPVTLSFAAEGGGRVTIPAGAVPAEGAIVWLAVYDSAHETPVLRGENKGKTLRYSNVVRELEEIGRWDGTETTIQLDLPAAAARGRDGCAVILQAGRGGPILGAIAMDLRS